MAHERFESEFISIPQAGRLVGMSPRTINRLIAERTLKAYTVANVTQKRVKRSDVLELVKAVA